jgi:putative oxidoreductase
MATERTTAHGMLVWALSVLLAAVFFAAGIPKIAGGHALGLQAAAMQGFPAWLRIVVGVVEVTCAIGLLLPGLAVYAAIGLAFLMIPASITQYVSGEPGVFVPLLLLLLLLVVAWRRDPVTARRIYRSIAMAPHPIVREGAIAGVIGATCVALWFFVVDLIAGHPLFTPTILGQALFTVLDRLPDGTGPVVNVLGYTIFHYVAFVGVGIVAAAVAAWASHEPAILLGFVILFVAFEVGFYGFVALLQHASPLGALAWYQVMIGNLIAAIAMGLFIWSAHPRLHYQFARALD